MFRAHLMLKKVKWRNMARALHAKINNMAKNVLHTQVAKKLSVVFSMLTRPMYTAD